MIGACNFRTTTEELRLCSRAPAHVEYLVQAAWALVLSRYSNDDDVLFGITVSGRSPALPGIEGMVGCLSTLAAASESPASANAFLAARIAEQQTRCNSMSTVRCGYPRVERVPRGTPLLKAFLCLRIACGRQPPARHRDFEMSPIVVSVRRRISLTVIVSPEQA